MPLLELVDVARDFRRGHTVVTAVDGVDLTLEERETIAIIGESGSGKSTLARLALGLIACDRGAVRFEGNDLKAMTDRERRLTRSRITVVFQEPFESLDPRMRVGAIVEEPLVIQRAEPDRAARRLLVEEALDQVGLSGAIFSRKYPSELSGGQQQRVSLARAIVTRPRLVVLDEPTSSLDLSVQAQVLSLLVDLRERLGMAYLFITHDLGVAEFISDRVAVMFHGKIVELGTARQILRAPTHSYTVDLLSSQLSPKPPKAVVVSS